MSPTEALVPESGSPRGPKARMNLQLSTNAFRATWLVLVAAHIGCGAYLLCSAATYWYLSSETMKYYVTLWSETGNDYYSSYGIVFGIVGVFHGLQVLNLLLLSLQSKCLVLSSDTSALQTFVAKQVRALRTRHASAQTKVNESQPIQKRRAAIGSIWDALFSRHGLFGIESGHFTMVFTAREVLQIALQTYQSYNASYLLPRVELNTILIMLLVLNCWSTAAIQYWLRRSPVLERVASLGMDAFISIGMMILVPLVIFVPYAAAFDVSLQGFYDQNYLFNPTTVAILALENRLIFVAGIVDFFTKLIPQLSIILSLVTIANLIVRRGSKVDPGMNVVSPSPTMAQAEALKNDSDDEATKTTVAGKLDAVQKPRAADATEAPSHSSACCRGLGVVYKWRHKLAILVFCTWGFIITTLHLLAMHRAAGYDPLGCQAITRPWFSNGLEPCASLAYDCNQRGTRSLAETSFDALDLATLSTLAIVHCPELRMPSVIQDLTRLKVLCIYNVTIVEWGVASSISATRHTNLISVLVGSANMTEFPAGLLKPLPVSLLAILFSSTNLTVIPNNLRERWGYIPVLTFENGILTEVPDELFLLPTYILSLKANRLETIPAMAMMAPTNYYLNLRLKKNPLRELPAELVTPGAILMDLNLQETEVTTLPAWAMTPGMAVYMYDTPYCESASTESPVPSNVWCTLQPPAKELDYPTEMIQQMYLIGD